MLEHQILATVLQIVPGPGGVASFLRRNLMGKGLNGPSLPLDVGQPKFAFCTCDLGHKLMAPTGLRATWPGRFLWASREARLCYRPNLATVYRSRDRHPIHAVRVAGTLATVA